VAGGLELALWCDLRVAATDAVLGVYCRRFGVPLVDGRHRELPRLVGQSHALDLVPHRPWRRWARGSAHGPREPPRRSGTGPCRRAAHPRP